MAREFAREGAQLALLARDAEELRRAAADLLRFETKVSTWICDVKDSPQVERTISSIAHRYERIDVVVNNAGIMLVAPLELLSEADFDEAMQVHFWAPYHVTMAALPHLKRNRQSRIVNISSIGGRVAVPHMAAYCASKFALAGLSDALRTELAGKGIRVTTVSPGLMRTGSHINASFKGDHAKEFAWFSLAAGMPLGSMCAQRAARQIVAAARQGRPELTITLSGSKSDSGAGDRAWFPRAHFQAGEFAAPKGDPRPRFPKKERVSESLGRGAVAFDGIGRSSDQRASTKNRPFAEAPRPIKRIGPYQISWCRP